jgi:hypothetical protein
MIIAVFDQQPVGTFAAHAVMFHAHQHPAAMQPFTCQSEFEIAIGQRLFRRFTALRRPLAPVLKLYRAAAILTPRYGLFKITVIQRMILHFHGQALAVRVARGPLVTAQDLKTPSSSRRRSYAGAAPRAFE